MQNAVPPIFKIFESLLIGASIAAIPGPIFFELIRRTLTKGFLNGVLLVLGEFSGNFILLLFIFLGASQLLTSNLSKIILFIIGGSILLKLGISAILIKNHSIDSSYNKTIKNQGSFLIGFSIAVTSPIVIALWISLSGSYLTFFQSKSYAFFHIFLIAFGFLLFFLPLALLIHKTRQKILPKYIILLSRISGAILAAFGVNFFYQVTRLI